MHAFVTQLQLPLLVYGLYANGYIVFYVSMDLYSVSCTFPVCIIPVLLSRYHTWSSTRSFDVAIRIISNYTEKLCMLIYALSKASLQLLFFVHS